VRFGVWKKLPRTSHEAERIGYKRVNDICKSKFKGGNPSSKGQIIISQMCSTKKTNQMRDKKKFMY